MLAGLFEFPLCSLGWSGGGFHAWVQDECLLPSDPMFIRKAFIGSPSWLGVNVTPSA